MSEYNRPWRTGEGKKESLFSRAGCLFDGISCTAASFFFFWGGKCRFTVVVAVSLRPLVIGGLGGCEKEGGGGGLGKEIPPLQQQPSHEWEDMCVEALMF